MESLNQILSQPDLVATDAQAVGLTFENRVNPGADRAESPGCGVGLETGAAGRDRTRLDLDVNAGQSIRRFCPLGSSRCQRPSRHEPDLVTVQIDQRHREKKSGLDIDPSEGIGGLGEVFTLATTGSDEWGDGLAGPLGDAVGLGAPASVRPQLELASRAHRAQAALERRVMSDR